MRPNSLCFSPSFGRTCADLRIEEVLVLNVHKTPSLPAVSRMHCTLRYKHIRYNIHVICSSKMAIILPTGQWYAPSAVINDAWYCMVLHGIALYYIVLHGIAWYCMVLHGIAWYCMVLHCIA